MVMDCKNKKRIKVNKMVRCNRINHKMWYKIKIQTINLSISAKEATTKMMITFQKDNKS
jgi:hypothetical protein